MKALWRIASDTPMYEADDLSGAGAQKVGGRWNTPGKAVVYTATSTALACLETLVHYNERALPFNRYLVRIDVPDDVWNRRTILSPLPVGWDAEPAGRVSLRAGDGWLVSGATALLVVPSVVAPEETNVLINPLHADANGIRAVKVRRWLYDARLIFQAPPPKASP